MPVKPSWFFTQVVRPGGMFHGKAASNTADIMYVCMCRCLLKSAPAYWLENVALREGTATPCAQAFRGNSPKKKKSECRSHAAKPNPPSL